VSFAIDVEDWTAFVRGVARGHYHLLLGAGASAGGTDSFGDPLPLGLGLANDLIAEFNIPAARNELPLLRAYAAADRRPERSHYASADAYLRERFTGCTAPPWLRAAADCTWRRIWTLNIDDTLEEAYISARRSRAQSLHATHWSHPYFEPRSPDTVTGVYLHGRARLLDQGDENNLVFGLEQYLDAASGRYSWHSVFGDQFATEPFLVVGATLSEEFDLAAILARGNDAARLSGLPSLVVLKEIDELRREEILDWGLIPVEATGEDVVRRLAIDLPAEVARLPLPRRRESGRIPAQALRFLAQFRLLEIQDKQEHDRRHDFYAGHDPTWQDIVRNRDAVFEVTHRIANDVRRAVTGESPKRVICLHGRPFTGKSTVLLRSARESAVAAGADIYLFNGDRRLDLGAIRWWSARSGPMIIVIDGMAEFAPQIEDLFADDAPSELVVLGTERDSRLRRVEANIDADLLLADDGLALGTLSDPDINTLIATLRDAGRLGRISRLERGGQLAYFRTTNHRELFPAMAALESAEGFTQRMRRQYDAVADRRLRRVYAACAMLHSVGFSTPIAVAAGTGGLQVRELVRAARQDDEFAELVILDGSTIRTRQRTLATLLADDVLSQGDRFDVSSSLATSLAPQVNPMTISERTLAARITGTLMDEKVLRGWLGLARVESWYEEQAPGHDWNARFWEQRALAASAKLLWNKAESYAERAVAIHADAFTLNTLGTILLRKALETTSPDTEPRWGYWIRAVRALEESRRDGRDRFEHPYVTFFDYTLRVATEHRAANGSVPERLTSAWSDWMTKARAGTLFRRGEMREQLDGFQADWLSLAVREIRGVEAAEPGP
jgi:hypothetical protein